MNPMLLTIIISGLWHHLSDAIICSARGKFANVLSDDCRGYTMCLGVGNSSQIDLVCPEHSVYSHLDSQCTNVTSYQCMPEYNCTRKGDFPNINECSSYISCVEALGDIVTARLVQCPRDMLFNPAVNACVNSTLFTCEMTTTEPTKVFEVTVKYSPEIHNTLLSKNAHSVKSQCVIFLFIVSFILI